MASRAKLLVVLVLFTIVQRLLPYFLTKYNIEVDSTVWFYPWSFMPLTATCLYAGAYCKNGRLAAGIAMLAVFLSDLSIWAVTGQFSWAFPVDRWSAYVCYPLVALMGMGLNRHSWPLRIVDACGRGVLAEVMFFVVSNFAYFCVQSVHEHNGQGLVECYSLAIPFAQKAFASTLLYSALLFSPLTNLVTGESPAIDEPMLESGLSN